MKKTKSFYEKLYRSIRSRNGKNFPTHSTNQFVFRGRSGCASHLITPSVHQWARIKEKISKDFAHRLHCLTPDRLEGFSFPHPVGTHIFFDGFDHLGLSIDFAKSIIQHRIPFTLMTTPAKRREIKEDFSNDPLVYLIGENNGFYVTGSGPACPFIDKKSLRIRTFPIR